MKTLRWLFLLGVVLTSQLVEAQAKLGISIDSFPSQLILTDTITYHGSFTVHNFGTDTFNGSFTLNYTVNDSLYNSASDSGIHFPGTTLTIPPGGSVGSQPLTIHTNTGAFSIVGSSGVVIWPISASALTYDSAFTSVEVTFPANVNAISSQQLQVFINQQQLFINTDAQNLVKRVRIYDIEGQLLTEQVVSSPAIIPMAKYSSGCYFAEVILNDDSRHVFKLVNIVGR
jgi:hypothetical protein